MNKLLYPLLALCLTVTGSLALAQHAAAMDDMGKGSMTMEKDKAGMEKGSMERDSMKKDDMGKGAMEQDAHKKTRKHDKQMKRDKKMEDKMDQGSMQPMK